jgi:hypothetical protein
MNDERRVNTYSHATYQTQCCVIILCEVISFCDLKDK